MPISYAKRCEYIQSNPTENLDKALFLSMCVYTPPKADSDRVLTINELARLREAILRHEQEYPLYMPDYAIELAILIGMRVGEIATSDVLEHKKIAVSL